MRTLLTGLCLILLTACRDHSVPDVSAIPVSLELVRFEDDFFALDTTDLSASLEQLKQRHPGFGDDFIKNILGLDEATMDRSTIETAIRKFISDYRGIYDAVGNRIPGLEKIKADAATTAYKEQMANARNERDNQIKITLESIRAQSQQAVAAKRGKPN